VPRGGRRARWRLALPWSAAGLIVGAAAVGGAIWIRPVTPAPLAHFILTAPPDAAILAGVENSSVAIAPNGQRIAYGTTPGRPDSGTTGVLFLRELGRPDVSLIHGSEGAGGGFIFSPDGEWIAFYSNADNTLKRVSVRGGPPQTICKLQGVWRGGAWGADD